MVGKALKTIKVILMLQLLAHFPKIRKKRIVIALSRKSELPFFSSNLGSVLLTLFQYKNTVIYFLKLHLREFDANRKQRIIPCSIVSGQTIIDLPPKENREVIPSILIPE